MSIAFLDVLYECVFVLHPFHRYLCRLKSTQRVRATTRTDYSLLVLYENRALRPKLFMLISVASGFQLLFWSYLTYSAWADYKRLPREDVKELLEKQTGFHSLKWRVGLSTLALSGGLCFSLLASMYPLRTVTRVVFDSKQNIIKLFTCSPTGTERSIETVPHKIFGTIGRRYAGSYLSLKIKGYSFRFLLDARGKFPQPRVFDRLITMRWIGKRSQNEEGVIWNLYFVSVMMCMYNISTTFFCFGDNNYSMTISQALQPNMIYPIVLILKF